MNEIVPVIFGLLAGALLGAVTARRRLATGAAASVVLGAAATVLTGESAISWAFLLIDIPLVGGAALLAYCASRHVTIRRAQRAVG